MGNKETWDLRREQIRELRRGLTDAEKLLWSRLRNRGLGGLKFRRQVGIDRYVVDFYCHTEKLVVELDGPVHESESQSEHDLNRDIYLRSLGLRILRVPNEDVYGDIEGVVQKILDATRS